MKLIKKLTTIFPTKLTTWSILIFNIVDNYSTFQKSCEILLKIKSSFVSRPTIYVSFHAPDFNCFPQIIHHPLKPPSTIMKRKQRTITRRTKKFYTECNFEIFSHDNLLQSHTMENKTSIKSLMQEGALRPETKDIHAILSVVLSTFQTVI